MRPLNDDDRATVIEILAREMPNFELVADDGPMEPEPIPIPKGPVNGDDGVLGLVESPTIKALAEHYRRLGLSAADVLEEILRETIADGPGERPDERPVDARQILVKPRRAAPDARPIAMLVSLSQQTVVGIQA